MPYIVCKHPAVRMDIVVKKEYEPQLVGYFERMGCKYEKEDPYTPMKGVEYVILRDISAANGRSIGELLGLFYSLEWGHLVEGKESDKFYIMVNPRRKKKGAKKHVQTNRPEPDQGSHSGNSGESSGNPGPGTVGGPAGDGIDAGFAADPDDLWEEPRM